MFRWTSRLLHWRQGNETIIRGMQTQFIPYNGVYVIARPWHNNVVLTIVNGTRKSAVMKMGRYQEVIGQTKRAKDVLTDSYYDLTGDLTLKPRQSLILDFQKDVNN